MLNPIVSFFILLTEMLIVYIFFSNIFERRYGTIFCLGIGVLLYAIASGINIISRNNGLINLITSLMICTVFSVLCFKSKLMQSIFYAVILTIINGAIETILLTTVNAISGIPIFAYNSSMSLLILEASTCKIIYFFVVLILSRIVKSKVSKGRLPFNLFLYPVSTSGCLLIFWYMETLPETPESVQALLSGASLFLLAATILLFVSYQNQLEKERNSVFIKAEYERLQKEQSYYQILEKQNHDLMIYAHDTKNHLAAISQLSSDPQIANYISRLSTQLKEYSQNCHSGNKLLDVMIHKYTTDCTMRGIHFDYDVKLCNLNGIEEIDLVAILGNLMDNAIAAAEKASKKEVSLTTSKHNSYSIIVLCNSCDEVPQEKSGHLITSKSDSTFHGFGLQSVKKALRKYDGDFEWEYSKESHRFTVTVMIGPLKRIIH